MESVKILIAAFASVLVGIMLIGSVATSTYDVTGRGVQVTDESINISNCYNGDSGYCNQTIVFNTGHTGVQCSNGEGRLVADSVVITNQTGSVLTSGNYTVTYGNSSFVLKNTSTTDPVSYGGNFFGGNISLIDYQYYPTSYLCEGWNRSVLNLVPGFFGIAILGIGVGLFYLVAKQEGLLGQL